MKRFSYKGYVPMRRGRLDLLVGEGVAKALGIDSGDVYVEVVARLQAPRRKKKPEGKVYRVSKALRQLLREADARLGVCPGCGKRMEEVHDVMGDSWQCRECGHTEEMWQAYGGYSMNMKALMEETAGKLERLSLDLEEWNELERRQKEASAPPEALASPSFDGVVRLAKEIVEAHAEGKDDDDQAHWCFEAVLEAIYGKGIWDWWNARC